MVLQGFTLFLGCGGTSAQLAVGRLPNKKYSRNDALGTCARLIGEEARFRESAIPRGLHRCPFVGADLASLRLDNQARPAAALAPHRNPGMA